MSMRKLLVGAGLATVMLSLSACGGSDTMSASEEATQRQADLYAIEQLESKFHESMSKHDVDLMMSIWAPNATFTTGPGQTLTGKEQIRRHWRTKSILFKPETNWVSDTAAYKIRTTVNGDKGTIYFECHFLDPKTAKVMLVTAADQQVARIDGAWLITNMVGASATLSP